MARREIFLWTLVFGLFWNILGWLGNNLLLGEAWDAVGARLAPSFAAPWGSLARELVSLASDFVYAFAFVWLFAQVHERTVRSAIGLVLVIFVATAPLLPWALRRVEKRAASP